MRWWKRLICSVVSLVWGFVSLDYLYLTLCLMSNHQEQVAWPFVQKPGISQLVGFGLFLLWLFVSMVFVAVIRYLSPRIDLIQKDAKTGEKRWKHRWFDMYLQGALFITGMILRMAYLMLFYFPSH